MVITRNTLADLLTEKVGKSISQHAHCALDVERERASREIVYFAAVIVSFYIFVLLAIYYDCFKTGADADSSGKHRVALPLHL